MIGEQKVLSTLFADCWEDDVLKQRFKTNPKVVLAEYSLDMPEGIEVNVVENTDSVVNLTLPAAPDADSDLSDDELVASAGASGINYVCSHHCCNRTT